MIPITLIYKKNDKNMKVSARHYVVPDLGEKVIPPDEEREMLVIAVDHDLRDNTIYVVLN